MELGRQIKKYRTAMHLSQEELAAKVYVTRQTVSNWENDKNYPDIHSLLLLSSLFHISLDQLIKGDLELMKTKLNQTNPDEVRKFNRHSVIFALLLILCILSAVPLSILFGYYGLLIFAVLFAVTMYFALKLEAYKKQHDIHTIKEIMAYLEGKPLDEIAKVQEEAKRPYQKVLSVLISAAITFCVCMLLFWIAQRFFL